MKILFVCLLAISIGAGIAFYTYKLEQRPTLKKVVDNAMLGVEGRYGIIIKNYKTGEEYRLHDHETFTSGSLYKLWVMALTFQYIQDGKLTKDQVLSEDVATLNDDFDIDDDAAELTDGTMTLSVSDALSQMITISHNYAALLLTEKLKLSELSKFIEKQGFRESSLGKDNTSPQTTASDIALFYDQLYTGKLVSKDASKEMLELLKNQQLNDGLPKFLPQNTVIAHKTGDIGWFKHDAGIVFLANGDYSIVILSETNSPTDAQAQMAKVSLAVYQYFHAKKPDADKFRAFFSH